MTSISVFAERYGESREAGQPQQRDSSLVMTNATGSRSIIAPSIDVVSQTTGKL